MTANRLDPARHPWMVQPETRAVMDALNRDGDQARFVGGCVRNALRGEAVSDIDIATRHHPETVMALAKSAGLKPVPTGIDHGTITVVSSGIPYEVTTLRKDVETDGRRAVVAFAEDWAEDAARRDFRLNAIYARPDGALFDPFGGAADARAGRVVFIGEAEQRIREDYLRILRFYRFSARYAAAGIDLRGQAACVALREGLATLSVERIWIELKKLLAARDPLEALQAMQEGNILDECLPGPLDFRQLSRIIKRDQAEDRVPEPLLRAAALAGGDEALEVAETPRLRVEPPVDEIHHRLTSVTRPCSRACTTRPAGAPAAACSRARSSARRIPRAWRRCPCRAWRRS